MSSIDNDDKQSTAGRLGQTDRRRTERDGDLGPLPASIGAVQITVAVTDLDRVKIIQKGPKRSPGLMSIQIRRRSLERGQILRVYLIHQNWPL